MLAGLIVREHIAHWMEITHKYILKLKQIHFSIREQIAHWMEATLDDATDPWGVKVERVEM